MTLMSTDGCNAIRCGAHAVYKEHVESIQQLKTCVSDYGNMVHVNRDDYHEELGYEEKAYANTFVYEEKSDEMSSKLNRSIFGKSMIFSNMGTTSNPFIPSLIS